MRQAGAAHVIIGEHEGVQSPGPAPSGVNYLLVSLRAGEGGHTNRPVAIALLGWPLPRGRLRLRRSSHALAKWWLSSPVRPRLNYEPRAPRTWSSSWAPPYRIRTHCTLATIQYTPPLKPLKPAGDALPNWAVSSRKLVTGGQHLAPSQCSDEVRFLRPIPAGRGVGWVRHKADSLQRSTFTHDVARHVSTSAPAWHSNGRRRRGDIPR